MKNSNIIVHKKRKTPFTIVPNELWDDLRLSWKAKAILGYLIGKPEGWKVRIADLCKKSTDKVTAVRTGLRELRTAGYAKLECVKDDSGRIIEWLLKVADTPMFALESPDVDFPHVEKPEVDSPDVENRRHSNKEGVARKKFYQEAGASAPRGEASSPAPLPRGAARRTGNGSEPTSSVRATADAVAEEDDFELQENGKELLRLWNQYYPKIFKRDFKPNGDDLVALQYLADEVKPYEMMGLILTMWGLHRKPEGEFDPYFYCTRYSSRPRDIWKTVCRDGISNLDKMRHELSWRGRPEQVKYGYTWFEKTQVKAQVPAGS